MISCLRHHALDKNYFRFAEEVPDQWIFWFARGRFIALEVFARLCESSLSAGRRLITNLD